MEAHQSGHVLLMLAVVPSGVTGMYLLVVWYKSSFLNINLKIVEFRMHTVDKETRSNSIIIITLLIPAPSQMNLLIPAPSQ